MSVTDAAIVTVLFHPEDDDFAQLVRLAAWGANVVAVVNAILPERRALLPTETVHVIENMHNLGLARALNQGLEAAFARGANFVLLLDQDSRPTREMFQVLLDAAQAIQREGRPLACVAPSLCDRKTAAFSHSRDQDVCLGRKPTHGTIAVSATFATSGTLVTRRGWQDAGPMWEALFIDGIDHEWCFRARMRGLETVLVPDAVMEHDMGDHAIEVFGRFRPIHRSPIRHYHIIRNTLWLTRRDYIPLTWRVKELTKLAYRCPVYLLVSTNRRRTSTSILKAIVDGLFRMPKP